MSFEVIVYQLFRACNIAVSKPYLTERIKAILITLRWQV